jgi:cytidyltransferase-like protein
MFAAIAIHRIYQMNTQNKHPNVIWEGRFQPIHRGHIAYIKTLLELCDHLWLFVVDNERSDSAAPPVSSSIPWFSKIVDEHHRSDKNPLPFWLRLRLVQETLTAEFGSCAPITVWGGRRLDFQWPYYAKAFPQNRVFVTPLRDDFEDVKAKAWEELGEQVVRLDVSHIPTISATMVRSAWNNPTERNKLLHPRTVELLQEFGSSSTM